MLYYSGGKSRVFRNLDIPLVVLTLITAVFGLIMIYSTGGTSCLVVQSVALLLGIGGSAVLIAFADYRYLAQISRYLYLAVTVLLILVLIPGVGALRNGARSWFALGPVNIQPSEFAKIVFILAFANCLSEQENGINQPKTLLKLLAIFGIFVVLILIQPDFGTASVFFCMALMMLFVAGLNWKFLLGGLGALAVVCPVLWFFVLKDYQKARILTVFHPEADPSGSGYHLIQSKTAIGSGKFFGTGLFQGSSQVNNLLPERHTDFIFSAICEELGTIGAIVAIVLLVWIIVRCIIVGRNARDSLGTYICMGVAGMLIFQVFENIGMCLGLFPVTGITLPFFSYGGSSLLTTLLCIGLVLNVKWRSRVINF